MFSYNNIVTHFNLISFIMLFLTLSASKTINHLCSPQFCRLR